jgi:hypothetical protein
MSKHSHISADVRALCTVYALETEPLAAPLRAKGRFTIRLGNGHFCIASMAGTVDSQGIGPGETGEAVLQVIALDDDETFLQVGCKFDICVANHKIGEAQIAEVHNVLWDSPTCES